MRFFALALVPWAVVALAPRSEALPVAGSASSGLVFARQVEGNRELFRARLSDGTVRRLTETPRREETWPAWSEKARTLVYATRPSRGRGTEDILLWSANEDEPEVVFRAAGQTWYAWSPVEPTLVAAYPEPEADRVVVELDTRSREVRRIAAAEGDVGYFYRPDFSPDGRLVVLHRWLRGRVHLYLREADGSPYRISEPEVVYDYHARFTRESRSVVFDRGRTKGSPADVMLLSLEDDSLRNLTESPEHDDHSPYASPTRDEIAYVSDRGGQSDLYIVNYSTGKERRLTETSEVSERMPRFSPDGERLVVMRVPADLSPWEARNTDGKGEVAVVDREGRELFSTEGMSPAWMPPWR